ncbi:calcium-binding protein [Methylocapsa sp. S129]|uniref:calcium-binding protein n=1 Tax=Methylocapsa sp. S129 TaxID=1641869 RepID=UPI00131D1546|nr:calcium-binding protein [Methylocapsa sp. S129]
MGAGSPYGAQAAEAVQFYQETVESTQQDGSNYSGANIVLTGHSLGGGLAGYVGALYGESGVLFDNMPFQMAAQDAYDYALNQVLPADATLADEIYGSNTPYPNNVNYLSAYSVTGQIIGQGGIGNIAGGQTILPTQINPYGSPGLLPLLNDVALHSQALLISLLWAQDNSHTLWESIGTPLLNTFFGAKSQNIATALGLGGNSSIPLTEIAYTALGMVSPGASDPFGTTALSSLFTDADTLGKLQSGNQLVGLLAGDDVLNSFAEILYQYAGDQAASAQTDASFLGGAFSLAGDDEVLKINLNPANWISTFSVGSASNTTGQDNIVGVDDFTTALEANYKNITGDVIGAEVPLTLLDQLDDAVADSAITQIFAGLGSTGATIMGSNAPNTYDGLPGGDLIVGNNGDDTITGSTGQDFIFLGNGSNVVNATWGDDVITEGTGQTTINLDETAFNEGQFSASSDVTYVLSSRDGGSTIVDIGEGLTGDFKVYTDQNSPFGPGKGWTEYVGVDAGETYTLWVQGPATLGLNNASINLLLPTSASSNTGASTDEFGNGTAPQLNLTENDDFTSLSIAGQWGQDQAIATSVIDPGDPSSGYGNKLYAEEYTAKMLSKETILVTQFDSSGIFGGSEVASDSTATFNGIVFNGDQLQGTGLTFDDFQILYGSTDENQDDYISGATDFKNIYLGNGNNVIDNLSGGVLPGQQSLGAAANWVTVDLGSGNSQVLGTTAAGSVITADGNSHHDIIEISPDILLNGLTADDKLVYGGTVLTGGTHNMALETPYYYSADDSIEYAVNDQDQLVITPTWSSIYQSVEALLGLPTIDVSTYVANYQPYTATAPGTAGISLIAFSAQALNPFTTPHTGSIFSIWTLFNLEKQKGVDPLVVDLTGQGLNLTANEPGSGARFDVNNDGFANPSSWTTSSEGFLVTVDAQGDVSLVTGFAQLAAYDSNGDGEITDTDLSSAADAALPQLRVWVDTNEDHTPQAGELLTLDQAGVASISLSSTSEPAATFNGDSQVLSTASVTLSSGVQSTVSDVLLKVDEADSTWLGDDSVTANAAALPDLKGFGTLPDLSVALSLDEDAQVAAGTLVAGQQSALEAEISSDLTAAAPLAIATPTLANWRALMDPILTAWTEALPNPLASTSGDWWQGVDNPDATGVSVLGQGGSSGSAQSGGNPSAYNLVQANPDGSQTILDSLVYTIGSTTITETDPTTGQPTEVVEPIGYWSLASGAPITDSSGNVIADPTLAQALATPLGAGQSFAVSNRFDDYVLTQANADGSQTALDTLQFIATPDLPGSTGYWAFASGRSITDSAGDVVADPTLAQALATPIASDDSFVLNGDASNSASNVQPNYYFVTNTNAVGTQTVVDDLEYKVSSVTVEQYDPSMGDDVAVTESVGHWVFGSGANVTDASGNVITDATLAQALATPLAADDSFTELTSSEINFLERYSGEQIDLGEATTNPSAWMSILDDFVGPLNADMNLLTVRLMVQGPLSQTIFAGIQYNDQTDEFTAKTALGMEPVYQAIFASLQGVDSADAVATLTQWKTILNAILSNYVRPDGVDLSQGYIFSNIVGAYEASPLSASLVDVAAALGITRSEIQVGTGTITGTSDDNLFYVGPGQNTYVGDDSYDNYVAGSQFGDSVIDDVDGVTKQQSNILRFASLTSTEVTASRNGDDLILTDTLDGATLTIVNEFTNPEDYAGNVAPAYGVTEIMFADGVDWSKSDMSYQVAQWNTHDEVITGTTGDDVLVGGPGDTLVGTGGNETYIYESSFGSMTIEPNKSTQTSNNDTLIFSDLSEDDLIFSRGTGSAFDDLLITVKGTGDQIDVKGQFNFIYTIVGSWWINRVDAFVFSNGASLSADDLMPMIVASEDASGGPVYGFAGDDTIDPGPGNHNRLLSGGNGDDTYDFDLGYGSVVIDQNRTNLNYGGVSSIDFGSGITLDDLVFSRPNLNDLTIKIAGTDDQITIDSQFDYTNAIILTGYFQRIDYLNFSDGSHINADQLMTLLVQQEEASDAPVIEGFAGDDIFTPGQNNRGTLFSGGDGTDTYNFDRGDGSIVIEQAETNLLDDGPATIAFGAGISFSDLSFQNVWGTNNLLITINGTDDSILVAGQYNWNESLVWNPDRVFNFTFADGSSYSWTQIEAATNITAPPPNSLISSSNDDDILVAGSGDDYFMGKAGSHTYEFASGFGQDVIYNENPGFYSDSPDDRVVFGPGISESDMEFARDGNDLIIHEMGTTSTLTIVNQVPGSFNYINSFDFADGTVLTDAQIESLIDTGPASTIESVNGNTVIKTTSGNPLLNDLTGQPISQLTYSSGDGFVTIDFLGYSVDTTLTFTDIASTQVHIAAESTDSEDMVFTFAGLPDDRLMLSSAFWQGESFTFSDGVTWSAQDVMAIYLAQATASGDPLISVPSDWTQAPETLVSAPGEHILTGSRQIQENFVWALGDGPTTIVDNDFYGPFNNVLYLHGVTPDEVQIKQDALNDDNIDLYVDGALTPSVVLQGQLSGTRPIAQIQFDDGTVWQATDLVIALNGGIASVPTLVATPGDDTLTATSGNDVLDPGLGNITMIGGAGSDVFVYRSSYGDDLINESASSFSWQAVNVVRFEDLNASDLTFGRVNNDLVLTVNATGKTLTISNYFVSDLSGVEFLLFADGTQLNYAQIAPMAWYRAGPGNDTVTSENSDGTMIAGPGDDTFVVGNMYNSASTTLIYGAADGNLAIDAYSIWGFSNTLQLTDLNASDVTVSRSDDDLLITVNSTGRTITVGGEFGSSTNYGVQQIDFADGATWNWSQIEAAAWFRAGAGNVTLTSPSGLNATLVAGAGDDTFVEANAYGGNDTFMYSASDGNLSIDVQSFWGFSNTLDLTDLNASDLTFSRSDDDLLIMINSTGRTITVDDEFESSTNDGIQQIAFANGTEWNLSEGADSVSAILASEAVAFLISPSQQDDSVAQLQTGVARYGDTAVFATNGTSANDVLFLGSSNVDLSGGGGADIYVYSSSGGDDVIADPGSSSQLVFSDIDASDVTLSRDGGGDGNDLIITTNSTGKTITVDGQFNPPWASSGPLQSFTFADGAVWSAAEVKQIVLNQESAASSGSIYGYTGSNDTLVAGPGNKYLSGGVDGSETYVYSSAGGDDVINDGGSTSQLVFSDIDASDVTLSRDGGGAGNDLVITVNSTGKTVTIDNQFNPPWASGPLQSFTFADGAVWSAAEVKQIVLNQESAASSGSIYGYTGSNDTLVAGPGNKYLSGGVDGSETYVYSSAGGDDVINDGSSTSQLVFSDIDASDVTLSRDGGGAGNDLVITVNSTGKTVTVDNQFNPPWASGPLQSFTFADGTVWSAAEVKQIVLNQESAASSGSIYGYNGSNDTLVAGPGNKYLSGGVNGSETYVYSSLGGDDVINDSAYSTSQLVFSDIDASDVTLSRDGGGAGNDLVITVNSTSKTVTIDNQFNPSWASGPLQSFTFADGAVLDANEVLQIVSDPVNLSISAAELSASIDAIETIPAIESITLTDAGTPTLSLTAGQALDDTVALGEITNPNYDVAIRDTAANVSASIADLSVDTQVSAITLTDAGVPTLALTAAQAIDDTVALNEITNSNYVIGISDTSADVSANFDALNGDAAISSITLTGSGTPTLALTADQTLTDMTALGKITNINYVVDVANVGAETDQSVDIAGTHDLVSISSASLSFWNDSAAAISGGDDSIALNVDDAITVAGTGDTTTIQGTGDSVTANSATVNFWDNASATVSGASNAIMLYSDDALSATGTDDIVTLDATGNSVSISSGGLNFWDGSSGTVSGTDDSLTLYSNNTVSVIGANNDATIQGTDDAISIASGSVTFWDDASGTVSGSDDAIMLYADDALTATGTNDAVTIDGTGNSVAMSSGTVTLWDDSNATVTGSDNTIVLNSDDTLSVAGTGNVLAIQGSDATVSIGSSTVNLDGASATITGSGNTIVFNSSDTVAAVGTSETYAFNSGGGQATINAAAGTNTGTVDFGSGLTDENLWFQQSGANLQIDVMGTTNSLTIDDWFGGTNGAPVQGFATTDGLKLDTQVGQLVTAMATYAADNSGFNPTLVSQVPTDTTLQSAVAAAWHH